MGYVRDDIKLFKLFTYDERRTKDILPHTHTHTAHVIICIIAVYIKFKLNMFVRCVIIVQILCASASLIYSHARMFMYVLRYESSLFPYNKKSFEI